MVVTGDKIVKFGNFTELKTLYPEVPVTNHRGYIYPGFTDAHCHFLAHCRGTKEVQLWNLASLKKIRKAVKKFSRKNRNRAWIVGRGWDQNKFDNKMFPSWKDLDGLSSKPICLSRIDGHAIWLNKTALDVLNLNYDTIIKGGEIIRFDDGKPSGVFVDLAADWIQQFIPKLEESELTKAVKCEVKKCFNYGLTTLSEAGLDFSEISYYDRLQQSGMFKMRIYGMLMATPTNLVHLAKRDIPISPYLNCPAVKIFLDGALGSRGALLKDEYCDRHGHHGLQLMNRNEFIGTLSLLYKYHFQACVHAIGDSANSIVAQEFSRYLEPGFDARWRIEHAQIMDPKDRLLLKGRSIIPSVQPTHATSDAPWAFERLCETSKQKRGSGYYHPRKGAYAYKDLLIQSGIIALGTDFPVEQINPFATFYSAVFRKDIEGKLKEPFLPEQALTRKEALMGMTLWAAYANREDSYKGSLEVGKLADFIVLNQDLMQVEEKLIKKTKVKKTYIGGERVR
jgi:predicted amidohydrolase YtcJ